MHRISNNLLTVCIFTFSSPRYPSAVPTSVLSFCRSMKTKRQGEELDLGGVKEASLFRIKVDCTVFAKADVNEMFLPVSLFLVSNFIITVDLHFNHSLILLLVPRKSQRGQRAWFSSVVSWILEQLLAARTHKSVNA